MMPEQTALLKLTITEAEDGGQNMLSQRILMTLINASNDLDQPVSFSLIEGEGYTADEIDAAAHTLGLIISDHGTTRLNRLMKIAGTNFRFIYLYGHYDDAGAFDSRHELKPGQFAPMRYTFWLAEKAGTKGSYMKVSRERLDSIDLTDQATPFPTTF